MSAAPSELTLLFGRLHPLLVHLPIGFLVLLVCLEVFGCFPAGRQLRAARGTVLALTVPATILTALCGWWLARGGGYEEQLLNRHMWAGLGVAAACLLVLVLHWLDWRVAYGALLAAVLPGLMVASHFGGSLTHGDDYLTRYLPALLGQPGAARPAPVMSPADGPVFASLVQPLLDAKCVACHGPRKAKGGLRLDSLAELLKVRNNHPAVVPGKSAASELIKLLRLPIGHEDHMPPKGKPQPAADEIALLEWWIDAGAPGDKTAAELKLPASLQHLVLAPNAPPPAVSGPPALAAKPLAEVLPAAARLAAELGIVLVPLAQGEPWLQVNAGIAGKNFGDAQLAKLAPLAANLRWLDLAGTGITDAGLGQIARMPHLVRLHLAGTGISDGGLPQLARLDELEYLNLYGTTVTDAGLQHLKPLRKLRQLYLWQTRVSSNAARDFAEQSLDKPQIERWQAEIAGLTAKIKSQGIAVELGTPLAVAPAAGKPVNAKCPVSGKDIDPAQSSVYQGKQIGFCCAKCKAAFDKDPQPFLAKLALSNIPANPPPKK